jgi:hypothetical protein
MKLTHGFAPSHRRREHHNGNNNNCELTHALCRTGRLGRVLLRQDEPCDGMVGCLARRVLGERHTTIGGHLHSARFSTSVRIQLRPCPPHYFGRFCLSKERTTPPA